MRKKYHEMCESVKPSPISNFPFTKPLHPDNKPTVLIRKDELRRRFGWLPLATLHRMISDGTIPPAIHIKGGRTAFWVEAEIEKVIADILAEAGKGLAA